MVTSDDAQLVQRHPPVRVPWSAEYTQAHRALVQEALDSESLLASIVAGGSLPDGFGVGFDERVVEYPWLRAAEPTGRVLDAGSTLNHAHILDCFLERFKSLCITTLAPEAIAFPDRGVSYVYADLRDLPFRDGLFETVISLSTLEHVGMDNSGYGADQERSPDPDRELERAMSELKRVLVPGGRLLISVPYGRYEDHGWFRQFNHAHVARLVEVAGAREASISGFRYTDRGWQGSTLSEAADARYRDFMADPSPVADLAAAARAVACLELRM